MTVNTATTGHSDHMIHDDHISELSEIVELKHHHSESEVNSEGKELSEHFPLYFLILFIL